MNRSEQITFEAKLQFLEPMMDWVRERAANAGFEKAALHKIELAMEEALVNIINHAYFNASGNIEITCALIPDLQIEFTIKDQGKAFNPLLAKEKKQPGSLDEATEGGLGIAMMRRCMDELRYARKSQDNILTLIKKFSA